jgi:hypothetical protein
MRINTSLFTALAVVMPIISIVFWFISIGSLITGLRQGNIGQGLLVFIVFGIVGIGMLSYLPLRLYSYFKYERKLM